MLCRRVYIVTFWILFCCFCFCLYLYLLCVIICMYCTNDDAIFLEFHCDITINYYSTTGLLLRRNIPQQWRKSKNHKHIYRLCSTTATTPLLHWLLRYWNRLLYSLLYCALKSATPSRNCLTARYTKLIIIHTVHNSIYLCNFFVLFICLFSYSYLGKLSACNVSKC